MKTGTCKTCGAAIVWAEMSSGKMGCFDVKTSPSGRWGIDDRTTPPRAERIDGNGSAVVAPGFTSHFATCPEAAQHRKAKGTAVSS